MVFFFPKVRIRIDYVLFLVCHYGSYADIYAMQKKNIFQRLIAF